ncbi:hypothetical protein M3J09_002592 [Ascochyta lentis]
MLTLYGKFLAIRSALLSPENSIPKALFSAGRLRCSLSLVIFLFVPTYGPAMQIFIGTRGRAIRARAIVEDTVPIATYQEGVSGSELLISIEYIAEFHWVLSVLN